MKQHQCRYIAQVYSRLDLLQTKCESKVTGYIIGTVVLLGLFTAKLYPETEIPNFLFSASMPKVILATKV